MRIGSRPSRRTAKATFASLRAIPWGFSWMQSRHVLPGWYGVGEALEAYGSQSPDHLHRLQAMYKKWPFFRVVIDNAQVSLAKADMGIAKLYANLVEDEAVRNKIFGEIESSFGAYGQLDFAGDGAAGAAGQRSGAATLGAAAQSVCGSAELCAGGPAAAAALLARKR